GPSTKSDVAFLMGPRPSYGENQRAWDEGQPKAEHAVRAQTVLAWCRALTDSGDYLYNLRIAATLPTVGKHQGLLASAPVAYTRAMERELQRKREVAAKPVGGHVGVVGERSELGDLTVLRIRHTGNEWGEKTIVALADAAGNDLTWFASGVKDLEPGATL